MAIRIHDSQFVDQFGRILLLRGVNLAGSSKVPFGPNGASYVRDGFFDHRNVSFVGRPFPLDRADEHFQRLKSWGLTFLRFLVTWEGIEHAGPGIYDDDYIEFHSARSSPRLTNTASSCSSTPTRMSGAASPAATAPPAGPSNWPAWI